MYPQNDYRNYLIHSARGQVWKKHRYVEKRNGRYIYPDDLKGSTGGHGGGRSSLNRPKLKTILSRKVNYNQALYGGSGRSGKNLENRTKSLRLRSSENNKMKVNTYLSDYSDRKREQGAPLWTIMDKLTKRGKKK